MYIITKSLFTGKAHFMINYNNWKEKWMAK